MLPCGRPRLRRRRARRSPTIRWVPAQGEPRYARRGCVLRRLTPALMGENNPRPVRHPSADLRDRLVQGGQQGLGTAIGVLGTGFVHRVRESDPQLAPGPRAGTRPRPRGRTRPVQGRRLAGRSPARSPPRTPSGCSTAVRRPAAARDGPAPQWRNGARARRRARLRRPDRRRSAPSTARWRTRRRPPAPRAGTPGRSKRPASPARRAGCG